MSNILIILSPVILIVGNCWGVVKVKVSVLMVADIAFLFFFNKKYAGAAPNVS